MKVLFIARHFTYFRNFESVVALLAERGHCVHLAADREEQLGGRAMVDRLATRYPNRVSVGLTAIPRETRTGSLATALRLGLDHIRYADPSYATTPQIRVRARERAPLLALLLAQSPFRGSAARVLDWIEQAVPRQADIDEYIRAHRPDVILVTPLIELGSPQVDYLRAARSLGIRSALCVWSWDHLSSKALIRVVPDAVIVWNDTQRTEAGRFHGISPERVIVTGAQCFDQWFDRQPRRGGDEFRTRVGLPPARPFLLYVCSALFKNSPSEAAFVHEWVKALRRSSDPRLRDIAILVRPHPQRLDEWRDREASPAWEHVAVWGSNPVDADARADYFDSMFHATAVIGLNTSALVEAAIVNRPVFTLLLPEFRDNQEGTFHFHHLLNVGEGFLNTARALDEHAAQLSVLLTGGASRSNRPFVERFIRPQGIHVPATPTFVDEVEQLANKGGLKPAPVSVRGLALRPVVYALLLTSRLPWVERLYWHSHRWDEWQEGVRAIEARNARRRSKRRDKAWRVFSRAPRQAVAQIKTVAKSALAATGMRRS